MTPEQPLPRRPARAGPRTILGAFALASLFYPLLVLIGLYGEWLFAWFQLGHMPRPSLDDPKDIPGSRWLHLPVGLLLLGILPAGVAALLLNVLDAVLSRRWRGLRFLRVLAVVTIWGLVLAVFAWDPGSVLYWWFD